MNTSEPGGGLTDRDRAILAFEKQWWRNAGSKEQAIRERFQISATRYYQLLNALLDDEAALALEPEVVKRLRRLRAARQRARSGRVKRVADIGAGRPTGSPGLCLMKGMTGTEPLDRDRRPTPGGRPAYRDPLGVVSEGTADEPARAARSRSPPCAGPGCWPGSGCSAARRRSRVRRRPRPRW